MSKTIIKCANCGNEWPKKIQQSDSGDCPVCGKNYCAKWRKWEYIKDETISNSI